MAARILRRAIQKKPVKRSSTTRSAQMREDGDREAVEAEPEDPGDVERPQQAAAPAALRRVRRGLAGDGNAHESRRLVLSVVGARCRPFPYCPTVRARRRFRAVLVQQPPPAPAAPGRWPAGRRRARGRPGSRRGCRPGTRELRKAAEADHRGQRRQGERQPHLADRRLEAAAPDGGASSARRWPRGSMPVPSSRGTVKAQSRSRGRPEEPPEPEGPDAAEGQREGREERVAHPAAEGDRAPPRRPGPGPGRSTARGRTGRGCAAPRPTRGMEARATSRRSGDRRAELPRQGLRVDPWRPAPGGAARARRPPLPAPPRSIGAPAPTSSAATRRAAGAPGSSPCASARRVSRAGAKGASLKPAAASSRCEVVRRPLQRQAAELRQALPEAVAPHQPVGGGGDLRLRPQPRRQQLRAPPRRGRAPRSRVRPRSTTEKVSSPTEKFCTSSRSASADGASAGRSARRSVESSRREIPQPATAVSRAVRASDGAPAPRRPARRGRRSTGRPNRGQSRSGRRRAEAPRERGERRRRTGWRWRPAWRSPRSTAPAPSSRSSRKWATPSAASPAAVVSAVVAIPGPVSRKVAASAAATGSPRSRSSRKRIDADGCRSRPPCRAGRR